MTSMDEPRRQDPGEDEARNPLRRRVLELLLGGGLVGLAASILVPVWNFIFPPASVPAAESGVVVGRKEEFPPNSGKIFLLGGEPAILIRTPSGEFRAFSAVCTHLACTVDYRSDLQHIYCACHNGHFDLTGRNIQGPPPRPLPRYEVRVRGDEVLVRRA